LIRFYHAVGKMQKDNLFLALPDSASTGNKAGEGNPTR